jgi:hypothetical protein
MIAKGTSEILARSGVGYNAAAAAFGLYHANRTTD